jgi:hypothetical protein
MDVLVNLSLLHNHHLLLTVSLIHRVVIDSASACCRTLIVLSQLKWLVDTLVRVLSRYIAVLGCLVYDCCNLLCYSSMLTVVPVTCSLVRIEAYSLFCKYTDFLHFAWTSTACMFLFVVKWCWTVNLETDYIFTLDRLVYFTAVWIAVLFSAI